MATVRKPGKKRERRSTLQNQKALLSRLFFSDDTGNEEEDTANGAKG